MGAMPEGATHILSVAVHHHYFKREGDTILRYKEHFGWCSTIFTLRELERGGLFKPLSEEYKIEQWLKENS